MGGTTGLTPTPTTDDWDGDGRPDVCDQCPADGPDRFIVEWSDVAAFDDTAGGPYTFQAELSPMGDVVFRYGTMIPFVATPTVGIQRADGLLGQTIASDASILTADGYRATWPGAAGLYDVEAIDAPAYGYNSLAQLGTAVTIGDEDRADVELSFLFPLMGQPFADVSITDNGALVFGTGFFPGWNNLDLPTSNPPGLVAPFWEDLDPTQSGTIRTYHRPAGDCTADCTGTWGDLAQVDGCGVCSGGTTGIEPEANMDCAGVCGGTAFEDVCGVCVGGTTGLSESDPGDCPALPDFVADQGALTTSLYVDYVDIADDSCLIAEGCVDRTGIRKVLRFSTMVGNIGTADYLLGVPPGPGFFWDSCHGHYHYEDYADYALLDPSTGLSAAAGHKNGWCLMDTGYYDYDMAVEAGNDCTEFDCSNQGIGVGCQDTYTAFLTCQWIDITDVSNGTYQVNVTLNPDGNIAEMDATNNTATATVILDGNAVTVLGP